MAEIHCPICNRPNDSSAERCWYCQAVLPHEEQQPGQEPQDWLDGLRGEGNTPGNGETNNAAQGSQEDEVPEWLARIRALEQNNSGDSQTEPPTEPETQQPPEGSDRLDDILSDTRPNPAAPAQPNQPESSAGHEEESNEDWLDHFKTFSPEETTPQPDPGDAAVPGEPPAESAQPAAEEQSDEDWLRQFQALSSDESVSQSAPDEPILPNEPQNQPAPAGEEEPGEDWLRQFQTLTPQGDTSQTSPEESAPAVDQPTPNGSEDAAAPKQDNQPESPFVPNEESVQNEPSETTQTGSEMPESEPTAAQPQEDNWLTAFRALSPDENLQDQVLPPTGNDEQQKAPFKADDSMDWMQGEQPVTPAVPQEPQQPIEPASLPSWLQALRPQKKSETPQHSTEPTHTPEMGALAGIEGALTGEEIGQYYTKPQAYSGMLKISENQQNRAALLRKIADQTRWEDEGPKPQKHSKRWILRLIVTLLLLAAVFTPLLLPNMTVITPALFPQEVVQTHNIISALTPDKPVLIAADFDGSLYGELNWSMQPLLKQLMQQKIPIAYLSTNSVGAVLMTQSLAQMESQIQDYPASTDLVNLGYLAGSTIGLQSLARDPLTTLPYTTNLQPAWSNGPLSSIKKLSDFGALIVITENADTARYWIEQVRPVLDATPMLVVVSAQSAPLIQPYFNSGQINGYIGGLYASTSYNALIQNSTTASGRLSAMQASILLTALMILVGGITSLIIYKPQSKRKSRRAA